MSNLALASLIFGILMIVSRGPYVFAPEATRELVVNLCLISNIRQRIAGIFAIACGVIMIIVAQGHDQIAALVIKYTGWFIALAALFIHVIFTSISREILKDIFENMSRLTLRIGGVFGIGVGALFIYFALVVF